MRRYLKRFALVGVAAVLAVALASFGYFLSLPGVGDAEARVHRILAARHDAFGVLPPPTKLADAMVAVEDEHFYSNVVVDVFDGAARGAMASLHSNGDPGGSTIAQQLAKQIYGKGSGFGTTLEEIGLGVKLELHYSKAEILEMYLNAIYYGNGYWGYASAARGYFGVNPNALNWAEASMLAGLPQAPSAYDPLSHFRLAKQRQRHVLDQLVVNRYLSEAKANAAYRARLPLRH